MDADTQRTCPDCQGGGWWSMTEECARCQGEGVIAKPIGSTRACPDCGRPQHYTGTELGWCHDATFATLACGASPALLAELEK